MPDDIYLSDLPEVTVATSDALLYIVNDPSGSPADKKIKASNLLGATKATGVTLDTGTDDSKFVTAKSISDSHNVPNVTPSTSGKVLTSDGTDWISVDKTVTVETLTNKRITKRVLTEADYTTAPNADSYDIHILTAQSAAFTIAAPTGTPTQGQSYIFRIKDNGTGRAITWNAIYRTLGGTLPSTTIASKTLYLGFMYNSTDSKWDLLAKAQQP